jgi:transcriptional regulator with XRE-family HTH domain
MNNFAASSTDHRQIAAQLIRTRLDEGMTQSEVASRLNWHQSRIAKLENGTRKLSFSEALQLAAAYRVGLEDLAPKPGSIDPGPWARFPSERVETLDAFMVAAEVTVEWADEVPARVAGKLSTFWPTFRRGDRRLVSVWGSYERDDQAAFAATARDVVLAEQRPTEEHWRIGGWDGQDPDAPTAADMHRASRSARRQMRRFLGPVLYLRLIESVIVADN